MFKNKQFIIIFTLLVSFFGIVKSQDTINLYKAHHLLNVAQERNRVISELLSDIKAERLKIKEDLMDLQDNKNAKEEKNKLQKQLKVIFEKEDEFEKRRKFANRLLVETTNILQAAPQKRAKFIANYEKEYGVIHLPNYIDNSQIASNPPPPSVKSKQNAIKTAKPTESAVKSEKKEKTAKKTKPEKPAETVTEATEPQTEPKKNEKTTKKTKPKKSAETVVETTKVQTEPKKKEKTAKKTKPEKITETVVETTENNSFTEPMVETTTTMVTPEPKKKKKNNTSVQSESSKSSVIYKKFDIKEDVMANTPPTLDCNLAFNGLDNFTGKKKQETTPIILFAHTDDFMRAAMRDKDFVTCMATATRVEGSRTIYLNLSITIQSKEAQKTFGFLDRGAFITFRFINGKKMSLPTTKTDIGIVDEDKGTTTFRTQLTVAETVEFTASELDAIRIAWSVGYEDYEIFDMDILRNLFKCLDKK